MCEHEKKLAEIEGKIKTTKRLIRECQSGNFEYAVWMRNETVADSVLKDSITFAYLAFMIFISQDSTFWTFSMGSLFFIGVLAKLREALKETIKFSTKSELIEWAKNVKE